jgi:hypothetical protein
MQVHWIKIRCCRSEWRMSIRVEDAKAKNSVSVIPITGMGDFSSDFRYGTKIEISLLHFSIGSRGPDRHFSIVQTALARA